MLIGCVYNLACFMSEKAHKASLDKMLIQERNPKRVVVIKILPTSFLLMCSDIQHRYDFPKTTVGYLACSENSYFSREEHLHSSIKC